MFTRTELVLGGAAIARIKEKRVAVFGLGGVGGHAAEALVRCGIGAIDLIDADVFTTSNLNRQIGALHSTIGRPKVSVMRERFLDINPAIRILTYQRFFLPENAHEFDFGGYDYVVDAIDTVTAKVEIIRKAKACGVPVISCMGTGNKLSPAGFLTADIHATKGCPLAKAVRHALSKQNITDVKVVYSEEVPRRRGAALDPKERKPVPGSVSFVPASAGLLLASEVVRDLCGADFS